MQLNYFLSIFRFTSPYTFLDVEFINFMQSPAVISITRPLASFGDHQEYVLSVWDGQSSFLNVEKGSSISSWRSMISLLNKNWQDQNLSLICWPLLIAFILMQFWGSFLYSKKNVVTAKKHNCKIFIYTLFDFILRNLSCYCNM